MCELCVGLMSFLAFGGCVTTSPVAVQSRQLPSHWAKGDGSIESEIRREDDKRKIDRQIEMVSRSLFHSPHLT